MNFLYSKFIPFCVPAVSWYSIRMKVKYLCVDFCPLRFDATYCKHLISGETMCLPSWKW